MHKVKASYYKSHCVFYIATTVSKDVFMFIWWPLSTYFECFDDKLKLVFSQVLYEEWTHLVHSHFVVSRNQYKYRWKYKYKKKEWISFSCALVRPSDSCCWWRNKCLFLSSITTSFGSCVNKAPVGRVSINTIGRVSVDMSADTWSTCQPTLSWYVDQHLADMSVNMSVTSQPMSADTWLISRRHSGDTLPTL